MLALLSSDITASSGPVLGAQRHQQVVGGQVAGVLEGLALEPLAADLGQQLTGDGGGPGREGVVVAAATSGGAGGRQRGRRSRRARYPLKSFWVRSSPSVSRDSTASAARSTWNGSTLRSADE